MILAVDQGTTGTTCLTLDRDLRKAQRKQQPLILEATIEREHGQLGVWVPVP